MVYYQYKIFKNNKKITCTFFYHFPSGNREKIKKNSFFCHKLWKKNCDRNRIRNTNTTYTRKNKKKIKKLFVIFKKTKIDIMLSIPTDRMSGRRSSSITCRSLVGRRTSSYITSNSSDPFKVSFFVFVIINIIQCCVVLVHIEL